jgi:rubrerythrin
MAVKKKVTKPASKKVSPSPAKKKAIKSSTSASSTVAKKSVETSANKLATKKSTSQAVIDPKNPLGKKFTCYSCGTKFYDLYKPDKICPKCGADQLAKPALKSRQAALRSSEYDVEEEETPASAASEEEAF